MPLVRLNGPPDLVPPNPSDIDNRDNIKIYKMSWHLLVHSFDFWILSSGPMLDLVNLKIVRHTWPRYQLPRWVGIV